VKVSVDSLLVLNDMSTGQMALIVQQWIASSAGRPPQSTGNEQR
jgi:hypothetical protein